MVYDRKHVFEGTALLLPQWRFLESFQTPRDVVYPPGEEKKGRC